MSLDTSSASDSQPGKDLCLPSHKKNRCFLSEPAVGFWSSSSFQKQLLKELLDLIFPGFGLRTMFGAPLAGHPFKIAQQVFLPLG